jgi:hypothetical protein
VGASDRREPAAEVHHAALDADEQAERTTAEHRRDDARSVWEDDAGEGDEFVPV